jgi:hypothetical protein
MNVYMTKAVKAWASKERVSQKRLHEAALEVSAGQYAANLGGGLYKQRVALGGRGKSGGARTLLCFNHRDRIIFLFGFKKNQQDNVSQEAKKALKALSKGFNQYSEKEVAIAVQLGELFPLRD